MRHVSLLAGVSREEVHRRLLRETDFLPDNKVRRRWMFLPNPGRGLAAVRPRFPCRSKDRRLGFGPWICCEKLVGDRSAEACPVKFDLQGLVK